MHDYFRIGHEYKYTYYKIPKELFENKAYSNISTDAKILYGLLLDRMYLSKKNGWFDRRNGRVYQYFTIEQTQMLLHFGHDKVIKLFKELEEADLLDRIRQGQGKPSVIYLKLFY